MYLPYGSAIKGPNAASRDGLLLTDAMMHGSLEEKNTPNAEYQVEAFQGELEANPSVSAPSMLFGKYCTVPRYHKYATILINEYNRRTRQVQK